jgi:hypothetical protein
MAKTKKRPTKKQREFTTRYAAVFGTPIKDKDARAIGRRLEQLHKKHGKLTPEIVLDDARRPRSILHSYFEWDDTTAAEKWRREQARHLIKAVRVIIEAPGEPDREMRAFVHVVSEERKSLYLPAIQAMDDVAYRRQVLDRLKKELDDLRNRYGQVLDVAELFDAIDAQLRRVAAELAA